MSRPQLLTPADFLGPAGNATDKYRTRNPVVRTLLARFLEELERSLSLVEATSILDVGCGEGVVTERFARLTDVPTVGVDLGSDVLLEQWAEREADGLRFEAASAYDLPFDNASFDCVCAIEVLEHLERPREALAELARVTRRALLLSVPQEPAWRIVHVLAGRDVRRLGNTPGHINHWSAEEFRTLVSEFATVTRTRRPFPWTVVVGDTAPAETRPSLTGRAGAPEHLARSRPLRVAYFGTYERHYPRNAQVISCLRGAGVLVEERHEPVWDDQEHKFGSGLASAIRLARAELRLARTSQGDFDVMIVGYPGHFDMPRARRLAGDRPLVFNPLLSLYDSLVLDRGRWSERSIPARALRAIDRRAIRLADLTIADTGAHAEYFAELAGVPRERIEVCLLGTEERVFQPGWERQTDFHCLFFGKLIPLHGLETILEAARLTPEIPFRIIGTGQLDALLERDRPPNVEWIRWVDYELLPAELHRSGCALGIFGTTDKALRVIPNKAYMALASGAPLITSDTAAARELLRDDESALLVPSGDAEALASAIRRLAEDADLAVRIADGGLDAYRTHASEEVLGRRWRGLLERLVSG